MTQGNKVTILTGKRHVGTGCIGGMTAMCKHLYHDGFNPVIVQIRSTMEYGYGIDKWRIYV